MCFCDIICLSCAEYVREQAIRWCDSNFDLVVDVAVPFLETALGPHHVRKRLLYFSEDDSLKKLMVVCRECCQ